MTSNRNAVKNAESGRPSRRRRWRDEEALRCRQLADCHFGCGPVCTWGGLCVGKTNGCQIMNISPDGRE
jgi:hypothetical protein